MSSRISGMELKGIAVDYTNSQHTTSQFTKKLQSTNNKSQRNSKPPSGQISKAHFERLMLFLRLELLCGLCFVICDFPRQSGVTFSQASIRRGLYVSRP